MMSVAVAAGYRGEMVLRPLRRAPMMLGGVGFQYGLDEARRKQQLQQQHAARAPAKIDVVQQLKGIQELLDGGVLTPEEFEMLKRRVLAASTG
jgi:hypothetical protein